MAHFLPISGLCSPLSWLHCRVGCLRQAGEQDDRQQLLASLSPIQQAQSTECLPNRSSKSPRAGSHWFIVEDMSIQEPSRVSKRMDGLLGHAWVTVYLVHTVAPGE